MYSQAMVEILPRQASGLLSQMLQSMPVVMLSGPRSIGKSTLARTFAASEIDLDNPNTVTRLEATDYQELEELKKPVLIDEWQKSPRVLSVLKRLADRSNQKGLFIVTGSASSVADEDIWPLVGRAGFLNIRPMTQAELGGVNSELLEELRNSKPPKTKRVDFDKNQFIDCLAQSGYPSMIGVDFKLPIYSKLLVSIANNALTSEAKSLGLQGFANKLSDYLQAVSVASGRLSTEQTILEAAGVSRPSAIKYDLALRKLGISYQIPAFSNNDFSRLKKRPKTLMADTAMMAAINGWHKDLVLNKNELLGSLAENFVAQQLMPFVDETFSSLSYLRTSSGDKEIDFMLEINNRIIPIEVKAKENISLQDAKHIDWFSKSSKEFLFGLVFYLGDKQFELSEDIYAVPIGSLWQ